LKKTICFNPILNHACKCTNYFSQLNQKTYLLGVIFRPCCILPKTISFSISVSRMWSPKFSALLTIAYRMMKNLHPKHYFLYASSTSWTMSTNILLVITATGYLSETLTYPIHSAWRRNWILSCHQREHEGLYTTIVLISSAIILLVPVTPTKRRPLLQFQFYQLLYNQNHVVYSLGHWTAVLILSIVWVTSNSNEYATCLRGWSWSK